MNDNIENGKKKRRLPLVVVVIVAVAVALFALLHILSGYGGRPTSSIVNVENPQQQQQQQQDDAEQCSCDVDQPTFASTLGLSGTVSDCCCSFADLERTNSETVYPLLRQIVQTPFFAHFKVDLCSSCTLWDDGTPCVC